MIIPVATVLQQCMEYVFGNSHTWIPSFTHDPLPSVKWSWFHYYEGFCISVQSCVRSFRMLSYTEPGRTMRKQVSSSMLFLRIVDSH